MDPLIRCTECSGIFSRPTIAESDNPKEPPFTYCPSCGIYEEFFEMVATYEENTVYWLMIREAFETGQRIALKMLADKSMELPNN